MVKKIVPFGIQSSRNFFVSISEGWKPESIWSKGKGLQLCFFEKPTNKDKRVDED